MENLGRDYTRAGYYPLFRWPTQRTEIVCDGTRFAQLNANGLGLLLVASKPNY